MDAQEIITAGRLKALHAAPYFRSIILNFVVREAPGLGTVAVTVRSPRSRATSSRPRLAASMLRRKPASRVVRWVMWPTAAMIPENIRSTIDSKIELYHAPLIARLAGMPAW